MSSRSGASCSDSRIHHETWQHQRRSSWMMLRHRWSVLGWIGPQVLSTGSCPRSRGWCAVLLRSGSGRAFQSCSRCLASTTPCCFAAQQVERGASFRRRSPQSRSRRLSRKRGLHLQVLVPHTVRRRPLHNHRDLRARHFPAHVAEPGGDAGA